ncbi:MAG: hypothetical protein BWY80_01435 [Firmicutes bacterium ADurb.Bin456]|nr:MAG: hypothetical protein BWY80_01435 [Firmicutes bacterium ADurb.Bin456]
MQVIRRCHHPPGKIHIGAHTRVFSAHNQTQPGHVFAVDGSPVIIRVWNAIPVNIEHRHRPVLQQTYCRPAGSGIGVVIVGIVGGFIIMHIDSFTSELIHHGFANLVNAALEGY